MKTIAVGIGKNSNMIKAISIFEQTYDLNIILIDNDDELVSAILNKNIDAVVVLNNSFQNIRFKHYLIFL